MNRVSWRAHGLARTAELLLRVPCRSISALLLVLGLTTGCSMLVESDREQCKKDEDCGKFESSYGYTCVENFCTQKPMCTVDTDCTARGAAFEGSTCGVDQICKPMCTIDEECTARGGDYAKSSCVDQVCKIDPTWACVGKPRPPIPAGSGPYQVKLHTQDLVNSSPMANVITKVCTKLDVECAAPLEMGVTDASGDVTVSIRAAFSGYILFTRAEPAIMPTLFFINPPVDRDMDAPPTQIASPQVAALIAGRAGAGITLDPTRGLILLAGLDCLGVAKPGLTFKAETTADKVVPFYSVGGLPSSSALETDITGYGGFINAPAGVLSIAATLQAENKALGSVSVLVKAGAMTITRFSPLGT